MCLNPLFFGIIIFLTHKPISKTNLRYFYVRFFLKCFKFCFDDKINKGQPKDKFVFSFLLEVGGEGGQDTPTSLRVAFLFEGGEVMLMKFWPTNSWRRGPMKQLFALDF